MEINSQVTLSYSVWQKKKTKKTKPVSDLNTGNWMCKTQCDACQAARRRRDEWRAPPWHDLSSSRLKSVSAGRWSYFWCVADTKITIMSTAQCFHSHVPHTARQHPSAVPYRIQYWHEKCVISVQHIYDLYGYKTCHITNHTHSFPILTELFVIVPIYNFHADFLTANKPCKVNETRQGSQWKPL